MVDSIEHILHVQVSNCKVREVLVDLLQSDQGRGPGPHIHGIYSPPLSQLGDSSTVSEIRSDTV